MVNGAKQLPDGWAWTTFGDIVIRMSNGTTQQQNKDGIGLPVTRIETISQGVIDSQRVGYLQDLSPEIIGKYRLQIGDILFSHINSDLHLGKTAIFENSGLTLLHGMNLLRLQVNKEMVMPRFFHYVCNHLRYSGYFISIAQHAVNQSSINQKKLALVPFPLPPFPEQERIVAKIEELFTQLEAGTSALERVQAGLRRYKASVLKAAVDGNLLGNGKNNDELPEGWQNVRLADVLSEPLSNGKSTPNSEEGFPVLRLTALKDGIIDLRERKIGAWTKEQAQNFLVKSGDFFVSRGNGSLHLVGRGGLVEQEPFDDVAYPDTLVRIRVSSKDCDIKYLKTIWNSNLIRNQIETTARTTAGIYKINQKDLGSFTFPLPPLEEQRQIVAEVERRLSVARQIESAVEEALVRASRLRQAVLRSAFEGRLT